MLDKITPEHLRRRAVVYVRQSTPLQVAENKESQKRQYQLADHARELGFSCVDVIDDDLGRSGSGAVDRPGFQRLVGLICTGEVGAILCIEASRLARNGRDWHYLIDLCGMTGALIIDPEGIYDPRISNDRLLLGLKGTMSEFELSLFKQRSFEAIRSKARRGELRWSAPIIRTRRDQGVPPCPVARAPGREKPGQIRTRAGHARELCCAGLAPQQRGSSFRETLTTPLMQLTSLVRLATSTSSAFALLYSTCACRRRCSTGPSNCTSALPRRAAAPYPSRPAFPPRVAFGDELHPATIRHGYPVAELLEQLARPG